jgi:hypothetical protein
MPKVSLDSTCIQIELTAAEAANYGFALNRPQLFRKSKKSDGGLLLQVFSIDLTKTSESSEVTAWIPQSAIYPDWSGSPELSTLRRAARPVFSKSAEPTPDSEKPFSSVSGYHPHGNPEFMSSVTDAGSIPVIGSPEGPSSSSSKASASQAAMHRPLPPQLA